MDVKSFINHTPWSYEGQSKDTSKTYVFHNNAAYNTIGTPFGSGNSALRNLWALQ